MGFLKQYRLPIMGAICLVLLFVVLRGKDEVPEPAEGDNPFARQRVAVPASASIGSPAQGEVSTSSKRTDAKPDRASEPVSEPESTPKVESDSEAGKETASETAEEPTSTELEFDPETARLEAVEKVNAFNSQLATTLGTFNPNARKVRMKAAELEARAESLDKWIAEQDLRTGLSQEDADKWQAQRSVWVEHSSQLKEVSRRLAATRGTTRKVRILAQEIQEDVKD